MPRMILLGVGTGVPDVDRENTHLVWDGPGGPLLIDAGGSTYQRLLGVGIDPQTLAGIVVTHTHADHINGLPALLFSIGLAGRSTPLPIYGLPPTIELLQRVLAAFELEDIAVPVEWRLVEAGGELDLADGWKLRTALTAHSRPCLALRIEEPASGRALVYSADTEPCPAVAALAQGAGLLIHEATTAEPFPGHTTPQQAGATARSAGAKRLVLVHFSPQWTMPVEQALAEVRVAGFDGNAMVGHEGQVLEV